MKMNNIKNLKITLACLTIIAISMTIISYVSYKITYDELNNKSFILRVSNSLSILDDIDKNKLDKIKFHESSFIFASIYNMNINSINIDKGFCNYLEKIHLENIFGNIETRVNIPTSQKEKFMNNFNIIKQSCTVF